LTADRTLALDALYAIDIDTAALFRLDGRVLYCLERMRAALALEEDGFATANVRAVRAK
jgi:hypothetical protein